MKTNKKMMLSIAMVAIIAVSAIGIGFAYTATTSNTNNSANSEYITIVQGGAGAYQFANAAKIYWNSSDARTGAGTVYDPYVITTTYTLADTVDTTTFSGYSLVKLGNDITLNVAPQSGAAVALNCQITASSFAKPTGVDIFLVVADDNVSPAKNYFKLESDNTFVRYVSTDFTGDNTFALTINGEDYRTQTVSVFAGFKSTDAEYKVNHEAGVIPSGPATSVLSGASLSFSVNKAGANNPGATPVSAITLDHPTLALINGNNSTLTATVTGTTQTVNWTTSNAAVASISGEGNLTKTITGNAAGKAIITATTTEGNIIATCVVTVENKLTVSFAAGDGATGTMDSQEIKTYDADKTLNAMSGFTKSNYHFVGWKVSDAATYYADEADVSALLTSGSGTLSLVAQWEVNA